MKKQCLLLLTLAIASICQAQPPKRLDKNPDENTLLEARRNHKQRIQAGIRSGELTKAEAKTLTQKEDAIQRAMYQAKNNDGRIDSQERDSIKTMLLVQSQLIESLKQNNERRN